MAKPTKLNEVKHRSANCLSQYEMFKKEECCDVALTITDPESCEETSIECHKLALIAASQYFRDVLLAGDDSSSVNLIDLKKGKADVVREALSFLYSGQCTVSSNTIVELLRYSITWKLNILEQLLAGVFFKYLTIENVVDAYELVTQEEREDLAQQASRFLRGHFNDVLTTDQFKKLSFNSLCSILGEDEIKTDSEDTIMKAVLMWLENNHIGTTETDELWNMVRFENLTVKYLIKELLRHPLMQGDPQNRMVKEAVTNLCEGDEAATSRKQLRYWGVKPTYDKLAKVTKDQMISEYDDEQKIWKQVGKVPSWVDSYTRCCISGDTAVLLGSRKDGSGGNCTVLDVKRQMITSSLPECDRQICLRGVAQVKNDVFVVGGYNANDVAVTDVKQLNMELSTNKWEVIEPLQQAVGSPLMFTYKHLIFAIGGQDNRTVNQCKTANQMYDTQQSQWSQRAPAPEGCSSWLNGGFIYNNQIHICTEEHHMTYTIDTNTWTCTQYAIVGYCIHPLMHGDEILACVGPTNDEHSAFVCKRYDEAKNEWNDVVGIDATDCIVHKLFLSYRK